MGETATVYAQNGMDVNFRRKPSRTGALIDRMPVGTPVTVISRENGWAKVATAKGVLGYMMEQYLRVDEAEDQGDQSVDQLAALAARLNELEERVSALEGGVG